MGFIWRALCSSLLVGEFCFNQPVIPKLPYYSDIYYLAFSNDPLTSKILVYAVYAVELAQTILFTQMGFKELAAGFGQPEALNEVGNFWFSVPILSSTGVFSPIFLAVVVCLLTSKLVELAVQFFYAYRIKLLSKSNFIPAIVVLVNILFFIASRVVLFL